VSALCPFVFMLYLHPVSWCTHAVSDCKDRTICWFLCPLITCANVSALCLFHVGTTRGDLALRGAFTTDGPVRAMVWDSAGKDGLVMTAAGTIWCVRPGKVTDS
jgi:hypothetical protein